MSVGLVDEACADHPQFAAERQICLHGLGQEDFRFVIGIAERCGFSALVVNLPIGFLGVAEPQIRAGFKQIFGDFAFERNLQFGFYVFLFAEFFLIGRAARRGVGMEVLR